MVHNVVDLEKIKEYNTRQATINPKKAALIVIDMQETFRCNMDIISDIQIENIKKLIDYADKSGAKTIFTRHNDNYPISASLIKWWEGDGDKLESGSDSWQIIKEFDATGRTIIDKNQYSAFFNTNLDDILKKNNIEDVIIVGVMTNCCCETTSRDAFQLGERVFFINDATSTLNADLHLSTLKTLSYGFAYVQNTIKAINGNQV